MQLYKFIMQFTGKSAQELFMAGPGAPVRLVDEGNGPRIEYWNEELLGPQPSEVELNAGLNAPEDLRPFAAQKRWEKEIGGVTVSGIKIATDDRSKQMIMGARIAAEANSGFTTPWVTADGAVVTLNAAQIIGVSNAVLEHVSACFATYATVVARLDDGTFTTEDQITAAFAA